MGGLRVDRDRRLLGIRFDVDEDVAGQVLSRFPAGHPLLPDATDLRALDAPFRRLVTMAARPRRGRSPPVGPSLSSVAAHTTPAAPLAHRPTARSAHVSCDPARADGVYPHLRQLGSQEPGQRVQGRLRDAVGRSAAHRAKRAVHTPPETRLLDARPGQHVNRLNGQYRRRVEDACAGIHLALEADRVASPGCWPWRRMRCSSPCCLRTRSALS